MTDRYLFGWVPRGSLLSWEEPCSEGWRLALNRSFSAGEEHPRKNKLGRDPSPWLGLDSVEEVTVTAHRMAEKFAGLSGPALAHSCWAAENSPLGIGQMRLMAGVWSRSTTTDAKPGVLGAASRGPQ